MDESQEVARSVLRSHRVGRLIALHADGIETRAEPCHFVVDGRSGRLVFPISSAMMELESHTVYLPEEPGASADPVLEMQVEITHEPPVSEELRDRHMAYHGRIGGGLWVWATIECGRYGDDVFDGDELVCVNGLIAHESMLCRRCNASRDRVIRAVHDHFGVHETDIVVVGVDGYGVDIRVGLGVVRMAFAVEVATAEDAMIEIDAMFDIGDCS